MIEQVLIKNYKSIRDLTLPLHSLNVLIGSNGAGKSNFISFFELVKSIYEQRLGSYTLAKGGIDNLLYQGRKVSDSIKGLLDFDDTNAFFLRSARPSPVKAILNIQAIILTTFISLERNTQSGTGRYGTPPWTNPH